MKSIVTEYGDISVFSARHKEATHHLIWGSLRHLADQDGLVVPITNDEHNMGEIKQRIHDNPMAEKLSKMLGQVAFEKEYYRKKCGEKGDPAREAFRKRYGKSYL